MAFNNAEMIAGIAFSSCGIASISPCVNAKISAIPAEIISGRLSVTACTSSGIMSTIACMMSGNASAIPAISAATI